MARRTALLVAVGAIVLEPVAFHFTSWGVVAGPDREIVVTHDDPGLPNRCRPRPLAKVTLSFLDALKKGRRRRLQRFFGPDFKWFSVTNSPVAGHRKHFVAYKAERAIDYIAERRGFNLKLKEIMVDGAPSMRRSDVAYDGIWTVRRNGVTRRWIFVGKGAINCRSRTVKVWSMSVPEDDTNPGFCPAPAEALGPRTVIACVSEK